MGSFRFGRVRVLLTTVMVVAIVAGCTGGGPPATSPAAHAPAQGVLGAAPVSVSLTLAGGNGILQAPDGRWTAVVAPGPSTAGTMRLTPSSAPAVADGLPGIELGAPVEISLSGGARLGPAGATLTRRRSAPVPRGKSATLAFYDSHRQEWTPVPTKLSKDRRTLTAKVNHLSLWTDAVFRGLQDILGNRADAPKCEGKVPDWVLDTNFLDDQNAPLLWCAGHDPADKKILVLKVSANRGWGFQVTPAVKPKWAYSSLGDELGLKDLLTAGLTGNAIPGFNAPDGSMWLAPGQSAHLGFTEQQVRAHEGGAFLKVVPEPSYVLAGLIYKVVQDATTNKAGALIFAIVTIEQCEAKVIEAGSMGAKALALAGCVDRNKTAANLTTELALRYTKDSPKDIGKMAGRAFRFVTIAEYGLALAEAVGDTPLGDAAFRLSVFTRPVPRHLDASCRQDTVTSALCAFVSAVQSGKTSTLTNTERQVARTIKNLPKGPYVVSSCVLEGDVTVRCEVTFTSGAPVSERTAAGFSVQPANGEYRDGQIIVPPGQKLRYQVIEYRGLGLSGNFGEKPTFETFAFDWTAHTSSLKINASGFVTESVGDGCCDPVIDMTYQLSNPRVRAGIASATARVLSVDVHPGWSSPKAPPRVGDIGTVTIDNGLLTESFNGFVFCDSTQSQAGKCGA
jgi:hypothetical protein